MGKPTILELLRSGFRFTEELSADPMTLEWPDDINGQAQCIRHLADMAQNEGLPYEFRVGAYDKLQSLACSYQEKGEPSSVPLEMLSWSFGIFSGAIKRPKRPRGRDHWTNLRRNRLIARLVAWLRKRGMTRAAAIKQVAKATNLSCEAIKTVLRQQQDLNTTKQSG